MIILSAALAITSLLSPFASFAHHKTPNAEKDTRVSLFIRNDSQTFHDLKIDGHSYSLLAHESIFVKAPVGTVIFADSRFGKFRAGDPLLTVSAALNDDHVGLQ